jgi:hypothetical protein
MTKEELYAELYNCETEHGLNPTDVYNLLQKFFESNVCTFKEINRHPYADILHHWVEGVDIQQNVGGHWFAIGNINRIFTDGKLKIKSQNPIKEPDIYEWKWAIIFDDKATITDDYYTAEEFWDIYSSTDISAAYRIDATQRIRKGQ